MERGEGALSIPVRNILNGQFILNSCPGAGWDGPCGPSPAGLYGTSPPLLQFSIMISRPVLLISTAQRLASSFPPPESNYGRKRENRKKARSE